MLCFGCPSLKPCCSGKAERTDSVEIADDGIMGFSDGGIIGKSKKYADKDFWNPISNSAYNKSLCVDPIREFLLAILAVFRNFCFNFPYSWVIVRNTAYQFICFLKLLDICFKPCCLFSVYCDFDAVKLVH